VTSASARFIHGRATREPDGRVTAHGATTHHRRGTDATPREVATTRTAAPRPPSGWPIPRAARGGIGIITDMTATTPGAAGPSPGNPATADGPDRATRAVAARSLTRDATVHWLTETTVAGIGQAVTVAITRHRPAAGQHPTWAETLAGVDPDLLTTITTVPDGWPLPPAAWRRDLRTRMMTGLKQAGWVTYSTRRRYRR